MAKMFLNKEISLSDFEKGVEFEVEPDLYSSDDSFDDEFLDFKDNLNNFKDKYKTTCIGKIEVPFDILKKGMTPITDDGLVLKQVLKDGTGTVISDKSVVMLHYEAFLDNEKKPFDSTLLRDLPFKFLIGDNSLVPGLELGIQTMKKDEIARIIVHPDYAFGPMGCPPRIPPSSEIAYEVQIVNFFPGKSIVEFEDMTPEDQRKAPFQKVADFYHAEHQVANDLFSKKVYKPAIARYRRVMNMLQDVSVKDEEEDDKRNSYLLKIYLNLAQCYINIKNLDKAVIYADLALKLEPDNVKGMYRMGVALGLKDEYDRAEMFLNRVKKLKPYDNSVNAALKSVEQRRKQHSDWERMFCKRMMKNSISEGEESREPSEFERAIEDELFEFLESDSAELPFSPGHTEEELEVIQSIARKYNLAFVSKIQGGEKITKLAKRKNT